MLLGLLALIVNKIFKNIVTDFITALPGNSSVNTPTYTGDQQYNRSVF
jgi:hypothetical protein